MQIYDKEQLAAMSDFEVNKILVHLVYKDLCIVRPIYTGSGVTITSSGNTLLTVDYCNNPNDIMPLAFEHGIHIGPDDGNWYAIYDALILSENLIDVDDKKPLRAITCCLILVLQATARPD